MFQLGEALTFYAFGFYQICFKVPIFIFFFLIRKFTKQLFQMCQSHRLDARLVFSKQLTARMGDYLIKQRHFFSKWIEFQNIDMTIMFYAIFKKKEKHKPFIFFPFLRADCREECLISLLVVTDHLLDISLYTLQFFFVYIYFLLQPIFSCKIFLIFISLYLHQNK